MPPETLTPDPKVDADATDGGWDVESASAPDAVTDPSGHASASTATLQPTGGEEPPKPVDGDVKGDAEGDDEGDELPPSVPPVAAQSAERPKTRKEKKAARYAENERKRREAEEREQVARDEAADLRRQLDAKSAPPAPPAEKMAPARQARPKLADFETEEAFDIALSAWHEGELKAREETLRTMLTTELDQRLARERIEADARTQDALVQSRMAAMIEAHPDYPEKARANAEVFKEIKNPFLQDIILSTELGPELLYQCADQPDVAEALGELPLPTRPLRDAVVRSSVPDRLMVYFATDGREDYDRLLRLHPIDVIREIGKLEARLEAAERGSVSSAPVPVTSAAPPVRPPVGSPLARDNRNAGVPPRFEDWMTQEDANEKAARLRAAGLTPPS